VAARRLIAGLAACAALGAVAAVLNVAHVGQISGASVHLMVDAPQSKIVNRLAQTGDFDSLTTRTHLYGALMAGEPAREYISRRAGIAPDRIAAVARVTANVPATLTEPDSEQRANDILLSHKDYRLDIQAKADNPVLDVYAQAPTPREAERLAQAAIGGLRDYLASLPEAEGEGLASRVRFDQLGPARGAVLNSGAKIQVAGLTFLVVFALCGALLVALARWLRRGEDAVAAPRGLVSARRPQWSGATLMSAAAAAPAGALARPLWAWPAPAQRIRALATYGGDWPRTTRVLPWGIAVFMAVLWLVPFNSIALAASGPIDLKFDRLVLPVVAGAWLFKLVLGGPGAPRLRFTWIHAGIGLFIAVACLSVVLDADWLNQTLEFELGVKKLTLLLAFGSMFVITASSVRRTEVPAFMKYMLALAAICALGTIWEYRFKYNVFYDFSDKLLPGFFTVGTAESAAVDEIGRRLVRGPAEIGLEAVAMLSMALPIALVGLMQASRWRNRILYALAACLLMAAAISTYRKSALLAPLAIGATLAYYRRQELLKLAPLGVILLVVVQALSPGAFGSIAQQLNGNRLGVATVSDRASDYDAVRPDLWTNLAFGRGYGTYDHTSYRILDSEVLSRLVEVGVLGLAAYLVMIVSVVVAARAAIRSRDSATSPIALAVAAAAVGFLVLSFLFDVMAFPHVPYLLLTLAGLLAVVLRPAEDEP
jgi:hypothetical protein